MNETEIYQKIRVIIDALNTVSVNGVNNLLTLGSVINTLEQMSLNLKNSADKQ